MDCDLHFRIDQNNGHLYVSQGGVCTETDLGRIVGQDGTDGIDGDNGIDGTDGTNGVDGITPTIVVDPFTGNWVINGVNTGIPAQGLNANIIIGNSTDIDQVGTPSVTSQQLPNNTIELKFHYLKGESGDSSAFIGDKNLIISGNNVPVTTFNANEYSSNKTLNIAAGNNINVTTSGDSIIISTQLATSVTYAELVAIQDAGELIPGTFYRITDYECTSIQENTIPANHRFDIILLATSATELNEDAWATKHEFTTTEQQSMPLEVHYFDNSNLNAWKIKYSLKNDPARFYWAKHIYTLGSGYGNYIYTGEVWQQYGQYTFCSISYDGTSWTRGTDYIYSPTLNITSNTTFYTLNGTFQSIGQLGVDAVINGKGVIYYMKDEFGNECPYDFKNIVYINEQLQQYTFNIYGNDSSLTLDNYVYGNVIKQSCSGTANVHLNNIILSGAKVYNNSFDEDCYSINLATNCIGNTFGKYIRLVNFEQGCSYNSFAGDSYNIDFSQFYNHITIQHGCNDISFVKTGSPTVHPNGLRNLTILGGNSYITFTCVDNLSNMLILSGCSGNSNSFRDITINGTDPAVIRDTALRYITI